MDSIFNNMLAPYMATTPVDKKNAAQGVCPAREARREKNHQLCGCVSMASPLHHGKQGKQLVAHEVNEQAPHCVRTEV